MNRVRSITTVLFDWDGTVVDSAQLGLVAFQKTFSCLGLPFPQEIYEKAYSPNWYTLYEALGLTKERWDEADSLWLKYYGEQTASFTTGAEEALRHLHQKGYELGIVSSGSHARLTREVAHLGLSGIFQVIICNEHMIKKKPHPEGLLTAMKTLGCEPDCVCYVGDTPEDIEMGKTAGAMTVGVRSSYPTSWRLAEAAPDIYLDRLSQLIEHLN